MAGKVRVDVLGQAIKPGFNGESEATVEAMPAPFASGIASAFPPIAEFAFLSDCEVNALIAPSGRVEWMCVPRPDSASVFAAMLDRAAGAFRFAPSGVMVPAGRRYLPGTLVLETTWRTRTGWLIVRDALCIGPWYHSQRRSGTHRRPPTDHEAEHILLRTAKCVVGSVELSLDCHPVFDYGQTAAHWEYSGPGYGEAVAKGGDGDIPLRLVTDLRMGFEGPGAHATTTLRQGEKAYVALAWPRSQYSATSEFWAEHPPPANADEAFARTERTADFWREWINRGDFPEHPWQSYLQRSALTLKGLTYSPTGALLAAPTTSLPETIGGERNWDYRYTWIRDGTFMLWGLYTLGFAREANDFFYFIADVAAGKKDLQIMYGIGGEHELSEKTLDHLGGYEASRPVRIGNAAFRQVQDDVCKRGVDERGVFVQPYGGTALDASVLLIPLVRFLQPDDPRVKATVLAIADELTVDGMVLRYRTAETDDGLRGEEGTFTICSFWLVSALCEIGELDRGRELCEKLLSYASPLQLYAEEIDPRSGRHLGNFPQAFSHLALINAVMHVIHAETGITSKFSAGMASPQP